MKQRICRTCANYSPEWGCTQPNFTAGARVVNCAGWAPKNVRHKFSAIPTETDGIKFDSRKEAKYYQQLKLRLRAGDVLFFLRQVPFHLPGGVRYVVDFAVFLTDGSVEFVDVKGAKTESYNAKKRMVEATYPITITEV